MMLEQLLTELRDKIDEDYADRIDKVTTNIKTVDNLEARAIERIDTINAVIQWAQNYEVDSARLTAAEALAEAAEKAENALEVLLDEPSSLARGTARAALRELTAARRQYREATDG
jgi:hypothetical protein